MKKTFKLSLAATLVASAMTANAGIYLIDSDKGHFAIGGNVELDLNYENRDSAEKDYTFDQSGRIAINFSGQKNSEDGNHYVKFFAEQVMETSGNVGLDDSWFSVGATDGWDLRVGRFEAFDMFPVGQDIFFEHTGDTSNELYTDGNAYLYQMKEGRGRGDTGQIMYSQTFNNLYVELATMIGDRSNFFSGNTYHGAVIDTATKDSFIVRPVVAYQMGDFRLAASLETNLVSDTVTAEGVDIGDRTGYGFTANYNTGNLDVNANVAYMDAVDETNSSAGVNATWYGFGVGYTYGLNDYENDKFGGAEGEIKVHSTMVSYVFSDIYVENFDIALGAYYTTADADDSFTNINSDDNDAGARIRFFYDF
jgi:5-hydroxyisourate hydrolase-like protein (transthyretin family)